MMTMSQRFLTEQKLRKSRGLSWSIKATSGDESRDLTPFLAYDRLSRLEWRIEDDLASFTTPDFQFELWYDEDLWIWLKNHEKIIVDAKCGFPFEKIRRFWGYVDKDNLKKSSLGTIYLRVYSLIEYMKTIKTADVFGAPASPSYNVPLRDVIETILDYLELSDQTIKVVPMDTFPDAGPYVMSYLYAEGVSTPPPLYARFCRIDDHHFYYLTQMYLWLVTFNDDFTDFTLQNCGHIADPIEIFRWDDDTFAIITADEVWFNYKNGAGWYPQQEYVAESIVFYDDAGTYQSTTALTTFDVSGYRYRPLGFAIQKLPKQDRYVILYNGGAMTSNTIDRCRIRVFNSQTHALQADIAIADFYKHPQSFSAAGYYLRHRDFFFTFLCPTSNYHGTVTACKVWALHDEWSHTTQDLTQTADELEGLMQCLGEYVCITGKADAYDAKTMAWHPGFWEYAGNNDFLGKAVIQESTEQPWQLLTYFNFTHNQLEIKTMDTTGMITTEKVTTLMPSLYYVRTGFTYWRTYKNKHCVIGMISAYLDRPSIAVVANRIYPYVKRPPLSEDENLADTVKDLGIAGCCIYHFPDNDTGLFVSRSYWDEEHVYAIDPGFMGDEWHVTKQLPRRIVVSSGSMKVEVGDEVKSLQISSDYIPDHDATITKAFAQMYHDFLEAYPYVIELDTDFLIQFEPFDLVKCQDRTGTEYYQGRLMKSVQEKMEVDFEIRGKEA
jgi:hypothetical protein